jgi:uncharacterized protein
MQKRPVDAAFTPSVKAAQARKGSRGMYEGMSMGKHVDDHLARLIGTVRSFYLATASAGGQPYIQHRGGPPGFLHVVNETRLIFADFKGNRQFITTGNLAENPLSFIFLMDYAHRLRIKIWGAAQVIEGNAELEASLKPANYRAAIEQVIAFDVEAWDANCPQHIPQMFFAEDVETAIAARDDKIAKLEAELAALRSAAVSEAASHPP